MMRKIKFSDLQKAASSDPALLFFVDAIGNKERRDFLLKCVKDAEFYQRVYTGNDQKKELDSYRISEDEPQKRQRNRISINRTKGLVSTIENIINQLQLMDTPTTKILREQFEAEDKKVDEVETFAYENDLADLAFKYVKFANLVDANSFVTARENKYGDFVFETISSKNIHDLYVVNNKIRFVVFKFEYTKGEDYYVDYELFSKDYIVTVTVINDKPENSIASIEDVNYMAAFRLGFMLDPESKFKTCVSIMDRASHLIKGLIWSSSDLDLDLAKHGIIRHSEYAPKCNFVSTSVNGRISCVNGELHDNKGSTGVRCNTCKGSGLKTQTSSSDIAIYPLAQGINAADLPKLSDMSHTTFVPTSIFEFRHKHVDRIKEEIIETIFNRSVITKSEVAATATEVNIDQQGIYATLSAIGLQVSNVYIWMVEAYSKMFKGYDDIKVIHGYTLNMKLETVESLATLRQKLVEAGAPVELIKPVDLAILQKQNADNPDFIKKFSMWEKYRPFSDKSEQVTATIVAGLPMNDRSRVAYTYWGKIKNDILDDYQDVFYTLKDEKKKELIDQKVQEIIDSLPQEAQEPKIDVTDI